MATSLSLYDSQCCVVMGLRIGSGEVSLLTSQ
jgi:hypothetical protein